MPRQVDYPRASLANSLELAEAVSAFGGSCTPQLAAERMNRKQGGAFQALIAAAAKYGLIVQKAGKLNVTPLFRSLKLAYTDEERIQYLRQAFLSTPLFREIESRFAGERLPVEHFEKMLIREFQVPEDLASRVTAYFFEGAKLARLIDESGAFVRVNVEQAASAPEDDDLTAPSNAEISGKTPSVVLPSTPISPENSLFTVRVTGPGLDSSVAIVEPEDLLIVQALLKKIERALASSFQPIDGQQ